MHGSDLKHIQGIEMIDHKAITYQLGNYIKKAQGCIQWNSRITFVNTNFLDILVT